VAFEGIIERVSLISHIDVRAQPRKMAVALAELLQRPQFLPTPEFLHGLSGRRGFFLELQETITQLQIQGPLLAQLVCQPLSKSLGAFMFCWHLTRLTV